jgi:hypothetical protein
MILRIGVAEKTPARPNCLEAWQAAPPSDFPNYAAGTWDPEEAQALLAQGHRWPLPIAWTGQGAHPGNVL